MRSGPSGQYTSAPARLAKAPPKAVQDLKLVEKAVQDCTLLGALQGSQLQAILDIMDVVHMKAGERRSLSDCMLVVLEGELKADGSGGRSENFGAGAVLGEVGLLYPNQLQPAACATKASRVSTLTRKAYTHAIQFTRWAHPPRTGRPNIPAASPYVGTSHTHYARVWAQAGANHE